MQPARRVAWPGAPRQPRAAPLSRRAPRRGSRRGSLSALRLWRCKIKSLQTGLMASPVAVDTICGLFTLVLTRCSIARLWLRRPATNLVGRRTLNLHVSASGTAWRCSSSFLSWGRSGWRLTWSLVSQSLASSRVRRPRFNSRSPSHSPSRCRSRSASRGSLLDGGRFWPSARGTACVSVLSGLRQSATGIRKRQNAFVGGEL